MRRRYWKVHHTGNNMVLGQGFQQVKHRKSRGWGIEARLQATRFRFVYTFDSGYQITGTVGGDYLHNSPHLIFNLRSLNAACRNPQGDILLTFDQVYGQFERDLPALLFSGNNEATGSFFSFSYRSREATVYDAAADRWIAMGWTPKTWSMTELPLVEVVAPSQSPFSWASA
jgi:hypothetical protein